MFEVWCEWDIGQEYVLFTTEQKAATWAKQALIDSGIEESYEEVLAEGLIGFTKRSVD